MNDEPKCGTYSPDPPPYTLSIHQGTGNDASSDAHNERVVEQLRQDQINAQWDKRELGADERFAVVAEDVKFERRIEAETEVKGGRVNYYLVYVENPQREDQEPYQAECEDVIEALALTPDEANIFKEIWRSANARKGNGKPGHKALYGAQKILHYAKRILRKREFEASNS